MAPASRSTSWRESWGVSQTPIRDALNRMEAEGLVVRVPHPGYRIPPRSPVSDSRTCLSSACSWSRRRRADPPNAHPPS
ncbi:GntR family transcriptional regulator, partial [Microbispora amethystogenes]|uniref:GntR family transcriptional regulator n=1 Tax=Microbispora amethystogenes TaxID=1427754 RepID=UPI0033C553E0